MLFWGELSEDFTISFQEIKYNNSSIDGNLICFEIIDAQTVILLSSIKVITLLSITKEGKKIPKQNPYILINSFGRIARKLIMSTICLI